MLRPQAQYCLIMERVVRWLSIGGQGWKLVGTLSELVLVELVILHIRDIQLQ